jgi:putative glutamine transport system permease protein
MDVLTENADVFVNGFIVTFQICILAAIGALLIGTVLAAMRISPIPPLRWLGTAYVEFFRNTPLLVQIFFLFFAFPALGIRFSDDAFVFNFRAAVLGIALYHAAYVAEVIRGGLLGVDRGQIEAARSLGLSYRQMLREVQLPQAVRSVIPPIGNIAIALTKNTALAKTIGVAELLAAGDFVEAQTFRTVEAYIAVALLYLVLTLPMAAGVNWLEKRLVVAR